MVSNYHSRFVIIVIDTENKYDTFPWGIFSTHKKAVKAIELWKKDMKKMQILFVNVNYRLETAHFAPKGLRND
jgi:hypothetical protein